VQKKNWGIFVFAIFVGAAVALIVFGLPLAIIGLFVASILDRGNKRTVEGHQESEFVGPKHLYGAPDQNRRAQHRLVARHNQRI
jgi:hypothetical protein